MSDTPDPGRAQAPDGRRGRPRRPSGRHRQRRPARAAPTARREEEDLSRLIEQPAKVMRIGSMIKQLLEEVRAAPLDEKARPRLTEIHRRSIDELESGLAPELVERARPALAAVRARATPSEAELRMAQAQLVGWLEGLFHGIQATLVAQQMAARAAAGADALRPARPARRARRHPGHARRAPAPRPTSGRTGQYL